MRKARRRYLLVKYSYPTDSLDALKNILESAYLRLSNRPNEFRSIFIPLQQGYLIFSISHLLIEDFKVSLKEEFHKRGGACDVILISGTLKALRRKARIKFVEEKIS